MTTITQNILFGLKDYLVKGQCLNPELFEPAFPASFFVNKNTWEYARFASTLKAQTYVEQDLLEVKIIRLVAMVKHNFTYLSKWRIRFADSRANLTAAPSFDSGWMNVYPPSYGSGVLEWGEFDWGGVTPPNLIEDENKNAFYPLETVQYARYVRIDFDDEVGAPAKIDNYLQFARLWVSNGYQPSFNASYGGGIVPIEKTDKKNMRSGGRQYGQTKIKSSELEVSFENLTHSEMMYRIFGAIYKQLGISEEIIAILHPLEPETYVFEAMYGNLKEPTKVAHSTFKRMSTSLTIEAQK